MLVSRGRNEGFLKIDVRRVESGRPDIGRVHIEVEVANFYPAIATWVARWFYKQTQSRIHVLVTHGFLRSLAKRELEESAVSASSRPRCGARSRRTAKAPYAAAGVIAALAALVVFLRRR